MSSNDDADDDESDDEDNAKMIRWAIVGLGDVCAIKSGPAFYKCHGSTLSAVMRRTPGAARQWIEDNARTLPSDVVHSIRAFDSVERMMQEGGSMLDAVYVASPPGAHLENVRQIIKATSTNNNTTAADEEATTIKAVYVEKPCGRSAWETRAMVRELHNANIEFYPAYVSRAHERTGVLRKLLSEDKVCGEIVTSIKYKQRGSSFARGLDVDNGSIPWRLNAKESGGGLIMDMGCHVLDRLDYVFGPLENVKSTVLCKGRGSSSSTSASSSSSYPLVEDYVAMSATIGECNWSAIDSAGATVECLWDFSPRVGSSVDDDDNSGQDEDVDELIISGPDGSMRMGGMGAGLPIEILDSAGQLVKTLEFDAPEHAAQPLIQSVVNELLGGQDGGGGGFESDGKNTLGCSPARADNAMRTSEVLDAVLGSYYGGRHDEFWTRPETWFGLSKASL